MLDHWKSEVSRCDQRPGNLLRQLKVGVLNLNAISA